jgi:hypothetical protein
VLAGVLVTACALSLFPGAGRSAGSDLDEYQVKAAFLFNFAKFVAWPDHDSTGPLVVGIVGDDPFGDTIDRIVRGKTINGRGIVIRRHNRGDDLRTSHIVFISASEGRHVGDILLRARGAAVLTVGETEDFLRAGGLVQFFIENNRIRFAINADAAGAAGLKIKSQLLSLAKR